MHETLGRHRADDPRQGWISGLDEVEGRAYPTRGGLRIGKPLAERGPEQPFDERLEWERDGQYFHYLTKWMHALARVARCGGDERHLGWAIELARAAHAGFTYPLPGRRKRMVWKMSIDLTRPLVPSMGAHDPLDGLATFRALRSEALRNGWSSADVGLDAAIEDMRSMCAGVDWATADPLGIGGLLCDAYRLACLCQAEPEDTALVVDLVECAAAGLAEVTRTGALRRPASQRLAFRELGLSIGLHAVPLLDRLVEQGSIPHSLVRHLPRRVAALRAFLTLAPAVETFWLDPANQAAETWRAHLDINAVMLATSLMPAGFLGQRAE